MHYLSAKDIRNKWIEFFVKKGHHYEKGASLIPYNDPTLLWINSGVAALKKYMDGSIVPPAKRIVNVQKSIRTNDIENVGFTSRHHTFFEMLGCFSIGDYFRNEIIPWAMEILTSEDYFALDKNKLYVTYNPLDEASKELWIKAGLDPKHLIALESNYWEIGEGPCGPNTEVFYDRGEKYDPKHLGIKLLEAEIENDRYIEIWGIVFSQYNAVKGQKRSEYKELPHKNIDTGAGLERIVSIIQETETNFETDLFMPIMHKISELSKTQYADKNLIPYRVIADHIRALTFAINDGAIFSNEGRGYVLRRLLRRAMLFGSRLGLNEPFLSNLVEVVKDIYQDFYPELNDNIKRIQEIIFEEENKFIKTLISGEALLDEIINKQHSLSAAEAFKLYDTYGFPFELTKNICLEKNIEIDEEGFNKLLANQKENSRVAREEINSMHSQSNDLLNFKAESHFHYETLEIKKAKVIGLFKDGQEVKELRDEGDAIFDETPFYATSGGQEGDSGKVSDGDLEFLITGCINAPNKQHLHHIIIKNGVIKLGDECKLNVDQNKRRAIMANHSATHLLQSALNKVLGDHIKQMGSFVGPEYLRFDFSHFKKISELELKEIEDLVNQNIAKALPIIIEVLPKEEALKLGAKHFFYDKYGEMVRVVKMGDVSMEFCGGTHLNNTAEIGLFKIINETSIASGVRRIEAKTNYQAYQFILKEENLLKDICLKLSAKTNAEILDRLEASKKEQENLKLESMTLLDRLASALYKNLENEIIDVHEKKFLFIVMTKENRSLLLKIADNLKVNYHNYLFVLIGNKEEHYPLIVLSDLAMLKAQDIIKEINAILGGRGNGKDKLAQGSVDDVNPINLKKVEELLKAKL